MPRIKSYYKGNRIQIIIIYYIFQQYGLEEIPGLRSYDVINLQISRPHRSTVTINKLHPSDTEMMISILI